MLPQGYDRTLEDVVQENVHCRIRIADLEKQVKIIEERESVSTKALTEKKDEFEMKFLEAATGQSELMKEIEQLQQVTLFALC